MEHNNYPELTQARDDMREQQALYRPTPFWDEASSRIVEEIFEYGIENFRSMALPLSFFVPTYGSPGNAFSEDIINGLRTWLNTAHPQASKPHLALEQFISGYSSALADYRVLLAADDSKRLPHLHAFSESNAGHPQEQFEFDGRKLSRSALNYLLGLAMLKKHLPPHDVPSMVLEIGGGFGTLGEILHSSDISDLRYIDVDIPPTSFIAQWYLQQATGIGNVTTYSATRDLPIIEINSLKRLSVLCAWQIERLRGRVDLFVNFISFQEMEPEIVCNYLSHVNRLCSRWILLRNMREGKQKRMPGQLAGVETPILGDDYLDMLPGYELVDRNVIPFAYRTVDGYHSELLLLRRKQ
jgi:putative sugar O-methyltransferase